MLTRWFSSSKSHITWEIVFDTDPPLFITYPHANQPGSSAPKFTTISGHFKVTLKKPDCFIEMVAKLTPKYQCHFLDNEDMGELPSLGCRIDVSRKELAVGTHDFAFVFELPCSAWPRGHVTVDKDDDESTPFEWRISQWYALQLQIVRRGSDGSIQTWVDELPRMHSRRHTEAESDALHNFYISKYFTLIASPVDPGEMPLPLQRVIEEFAPQTGPMTVIVTARCLTISAVLNLSFSLPAVPKGSQITQIRGSLVIHTNWVSPKKDGPTWTHPDQSTTFFTMKGPFETENSKDGQTYALSTSISARLPNDRETMPSTLKHTYSPLRISHSLVVQFEVRESETRKHIIKLSEPISLASCRLISEWVNVPTYGETPLARADFQPSRPDQRVACACGFSLAQLLQRENEGIVENEDYEPPFIKPPSERIS